MYLTYLYIRIKKVLEITIMNVNYYLYYLIRVYIFFINFAVIISFAKFN